MGSLLFEKCGQDLQRFLSQPSETTDFSDFIATTLSQRIELKAVLEQGRDRLLEINSAGGVAAQCLAEHIAAQDGTADLKDFALNLFDVIGMEQDDLDDKSLVIRPTATMALPDFPGLKEEGVTLTFEREFALAREEIEFLTWDHPMIRHGIDLIVAGDLGKTAVSLLNNKKLPTGTLLLELIYVVETQAPKALQLTRFLPPTPIRLLLDAKGNDLAPQVSFDKLEKQLGSLDKNMAYKIVKAARTQIERLLTMAEQTIKERAQSVIVQAKQAAQQTLTAELNRLGALQAVNKNIRQDEIDALQHILTQSLVCLQQAGWRLDSLRLIVSN
jgi:RNA polymerase recycling family C-terminal.